MRLLILLLLFSCQQAQYTEEMVNNPVSDTAHHTGLVEAQKCSACHKEIYQEWSESIHGNSSYYKDPIHQAVVKSYQKFKKKKGKPVDYHCANCHTPVVDDRWKLMKAEVQLSEKKHQEGVSCRTCHSMSDIKEHKNFSRPIYSPESFIFGTLKGDKTAVHPVKKSPFKNPSQMCLSCHAHKHNGKGTGICVMTGKEGELKHSPSEAKCVECHMPEVKSTLLTRKERKNKTNKKHYSHKFAGSRNRTLLKPAIALQLEVKGNALRVNLKNLITHSFPSSQPLRQAAVAVTAYNSKGKLIWSNKKSFSPKNKTLMMVALADNKDNWPMPPWKARKRLFDTRLSAGESRDYNFTDIPLNKTHKVKVQVLYRLISPKAAKGFGIDKKHTHWQIVKETNLIL